MIRGAVNAQREAVVVLRMRGPGGAESDVDWIIDMGMAILAGHELRIAARPGGAVEIAPLP